MSTFLIPEVKGLAAGIAYGVVRPWREEKLLRVLAPCVGAAVFRDDGAELWVCEYVHPRRRRHLAGCDRNDVLASIRGESAKPVEKHQIATRRLDGRPWFCVQRSSR